VNFFHLRPLTYISNFDEVMFQCGDISLDHTVDTVDGIQ
jgi:hypothetical protein